MVTSPHKTRSFVRAGALALIVGTLQFFIFHVIVESAWPEPYSWAHNNISDLGAVGCRPWEGDGRYVCSPLHVWMNASFVIQGVSLVTGLVLTRPLWRSFLTRTSLVFIFLAGIGWILVGVAPADVDENLHVLGALSIFFCGNIGLLFVDDQAARDGTRTVRAYFRPLGTIGLVATAMFLGQIYLVFGMGGMERFAVFPLQIWAALTGVYLLRTIKKKNSVHPNNNPQ